MTSTEKILARLSALSSNGMGNDDIIDSRVKIATVVTFILTVLSVPMLEPGKLVWMFCFPIIMSEAWGIGYGRVLMKSLYILPLIILVGIFNPIIDRNPMWQIGTIKISAGWVSLISITLRGLLSFQALIMLVSRLGFSSFCRDLQRLGCPKALVTQLFLLYRYIGVILEEALTMHRARESRGYGRKSYPLKMWAQFAGQLLLRSVDRSKRIHRAMLARGFSGTIPYAPSYSRLRFRDIAFIMFWIGIFAALRFIDFSTLLGHIIAR